VLNVIVIDITPTLTLETQTKSYEFK